MNTLTSFFTADTQLLVWINQGLANPIFDFVLPWFRNKYFWIWLYVLLLAIAIIKDKKGWTILLLAAATILLCDGISASLIKPWVQRIRPCNDAEVKTLIRLLVPCGSGYSFVSAHAANHFGLAIVFGGYFSRYFNPKWVYSLFIFWAFSIAFSQVYVGVHYPFDVICGALVGILMGTWIWKIYNMILPDIKVRKNIYN